MTLCLWFMFKNKCISLFGKIMGVDHYVQTLLKAHIMQKANVRVKLLKIF